ncbi:MAG: hypothetical protein FJ302_13300 [Planctomycetes bacterium]|nr:hypothetical protein [Planctomycetota bacterium]
MAQDTRARPQKPPEKKVGPFASGIGVAIWLNETESDDGGIRHFRSVTINPRRYFDQKSSQWKDAASYQQSDLPALIFALQKALEYCYQTPIPGQDDTETGASEGEAGDNF